MLKEQSFIDRSLKLCYIIPMPKKKIDRDTILEIAYQLFRTQGYSNTSMSNVADACGVFKSGLYHYFLNKETLMKEVLKWVHNLAKDNSLKKLRNQDIDPYKRLEDFFKVLRVIHIEEEGGCFFGNISLEMSSQNKTFRNLIKKYFTEYIASFHSLFREFHDDKEAKRLAIKAVQDIEGSLMLSRVFQDDSFVTNAHNQIRDYLP